MGTPHRGSDTAKWAHLLQRAMAVVSMGPTTHLLEDLKESSRTLIYLNSIFAERGWNMPILSFYELKKTALLNATVCIAEITYVDRC
jgi:hypothetical protein